MNRLFIKQKCILMSIERLHIAILCISFFLFALPTNAQTDAWMGIVKEKVELEKKIEKVVSDTLSLVGNIKEMQKVNFELKNEKSLIEGKIVSIRNYISRKRRDSIIHYNEHLRNELRKLKAEKYIIDSIADSKSNELIALKGDVKDLASYSIVKEEKDYEQMLSIVQRKYSLIKNEELNELYRLAKKYIRRDDYYENIARIETAKTNKELYEKAVKVLNSPYNVQVVDSVRDEIGVLLQIEKDDIRGKKFKLTKEQFGEIDTLDIKLSRYYYGTFELKDLVSKINNNEDVQKFRESGDKEQCYKAMQIILNPLDEESVEIHQKYLEFLPFLKMLLNNYSNELKENPLNHPTKTEIQIVNLGK